jgi:hypothetical protein
VGVEAAVETHQHRGCFELHCRIAGPLEINRLLAEIALPAAAACNA